MLQHTVKFIQVVAVLGTFSSIGYYLMCLWATANFLRERKASIADASDGTPPPVSILKPLKGTDPEMYESLRSHCLQNYPEYEILFGVKDANDPASEMVERLKAEFPQRLIRLVICPENLGANTKVSNLAQMLPGARYELLIVNDSDIRVETDYLRRITAPLGDPKVGMVTCLYRGVPAGTLGSRLESMGIGTDFSAGVLVARQVEGGIRFGLGSTLGFRRHDLEAIGGFQAFVDYLADDYEIGRRIAALGSEKQERSKARDGILGADFFRRFVVEIDIPARLLRLCEPGEFHYSGRGEIIPLQFKRDTPIIDGSIVTLSNEIVNGRFEIDTGCDAFLCLGQDFVAANELLDKVKMMPQGARRGVGGSTPIQHGDFEALRLGSVIIKKPSANFFLEGSPAGKGQAGHIGLGVLQRFNMTFDYSRRQMILEQKSD